MNKTQRLHLREVKLSDLSAVHQLHSFPEVDQYNTLGIPESESVTEEILSTWINNGKALPRNEYVFVIESFEEEFIGLIALTAIRPKFKSAKIWYKLHPDHWGKGFATEALKKIIEFGFQNLQLHRLEAGCAVDNIASYKVMEKAGMIKEGGKRKVLPIRGQWVDNYEFAILESDPGP